MNMGERIRELRMEKGMTLEELGNLVGVQKSAVLKWENGKTKNLKSSVIEKLAEIFNVNPSYVMGFENSNILPVTTKSVPMLGYVAAGEPIFAEECCEYYIEVDQSLNIDFCLKVSGDSMEDARINNGDIVFVRKQPMVENGEIAVVLIDSDVTLKRFYKNDGGVILKPENKSYQPKYYTEKDFKTVRILGKAVMFQSEVV